MIIDEIIERALEEDLGDGDFTSLDRKSTRLNSSHQIISYAVFCLKKKKNINEQIIYSDKLIYYDDSVKQVTYTEN